MVQGGNGAGFAFEPLLQVGIRAEVRREDLDSHRAVKAGVARTIDFAHAASA